MKTIEVKLMKFDELSKEAQEKAIEKNRDFNIDNDFWSECVKENWEEKLEKLGYENIRILYSGFYSQGDGACFTAGVDVTKWIKAHKASKRYRKILQHVKNEGTASVSITHNAHYYYSTSTSIDETLADYEETKDEFKKAIEKASGIDLETQWEKFLIDISDEKEELGNKIYNDLQTEYEYLTSNGAIKEALEGNDYDFDEDGNII